MSSNKIEIDSLEKLQELKNAIVLYKGKIGKEIEIVEGLVRKSISAYESELNESKAKIDKDKFDLKKEEESIKQAQSNSLSEKSTDSKSTENNSRQSEQREQKLLEAENKLQRLRGDFDHFKNLYLKPYNKELIIVKEKIGQQSNESIRLLENLIEKVSAYLEVSLVKANNPGNSVHAEIISLDRSHQLSGSSFNGNSPIANYKKKFAIGFTPHYIENRLVDGKDVICLYKASSPDNAIGAFQINQEDGQKGYILNFSLPENPSFNSMNDYSKAFLQMESAAKENGVQLIESSVSSNQADFYKSAGYEIDTTSSISNSNNKNENVVVVRKKI